MIVKSRGYDVAFVLAGAELLQEKFNQQFEIFFSFPEWGDKDGNDIQPEKQVLTKVPLANQLFQICIGGGDNAGVDGANCGFTYAADSMFLKDAEKFDLQPYGQFRDFI